MVPAIYHHRLTQLKSEYELLLKRSNAVDKSWNNGIFERYMNPVITSEHIPLSWRFDYNPEANPYFLERLGINAAFNPGAIEYENQICLAVRVEGYDRKSFFAIASSENGIDQFQFWDEPVEMPETEDPDVNVYDMRLVQHEDAWIYGLFCSERKDKNAPDYDTSSATAQGAIARTKDLIHWERLPDLKTPSPQQRNVVLHPEFINGKYGFYTRPMDEFIKTGTGGGIGWGLSRSMNPAIIDEEIIIDPKAYHTIKEVKNGEGPAPLKTDKGWLHLAHGVRNTAAGLRYVLYVYLSDLSEPWVVTHRPGGYFLAPVGEERVGDVSNVTFSNAWICNQDGKVFLYYASSDTRCHVVTTTLDRLLDYCLNTPEDALRSSASVQQRIKLIHENRTHIGK